MKRPYTNKLFLLGIAGFASAAVLFSYHINVRNAAMEDWFPSGKPDWVVARPIVVDNNGISLSITSGSCSLVRDWCERNGWNEVFIWQEDGFFRRQQRLHSILRSSGVSLDNVESVFVKSIDGTDVGYVILTKELFDHHNPDRIRGFFVIHRS